MPGDTAIEGNNMFGYSPRLCVALIAVLAALALSASAASANLTQFHSAAEHTWIFGDQEVKNQIGVNPGVVECETVTISGTVDSNTVLQQTIEPTYRDCKLTTVTLETLAATVDTNGCHLVFTPGGQGHVVCPSAPIRVTAPLCTITVHPQTINKVDYTNVGEGSTKSITVTSTATGIAYTLSSLCPGGGGGSFTNGTYSGSIATTCTDTLLNHVACWWSTT